MRTRLLFLMVVSATLSCGGMDLPPQGGPDPLETPGPDLIESVSTSTWPDAADLGVVVWSEIVPTENVPPPPDLAR